MKLGLLTAPFPRRSLRQVAAWAASERYDFVVSVEHEDRAFEVTEDLVKRGFLIARDALEPLIH